MPMTASQIDAFAAIFAKANAASETAMDAAWAKDGMIDGGSCGFAWVHFHDARHGFAKFILGTSTGYKHHKRGVCVSISQGGRGQGMHIAEAGARAFTLVLREAFPEVDIYDESRVD